MNINYTKAELGLPRIDSRLCIFFIGQGLMSLRLVFFTPFKYYLSGSSIANFLATIYHIMSELTYEEVFTNAGICWLKMYFIFLIENILTS